MIQHRYCEECNELKETSPVYSEEKQKFIRLCEECEEDESSE